MNWGPNFNGRVYGDNEMKHQPYGRGSGMTTRQVAALIGNVMIGVKTIFVTNNLGHVFDIILPMILNSLQTTAPVVVDRPSTRVRIGNGILFIVDKNEYPDRYFALARPILYSLDHSVSERDCNPALIEYLRTRGEEL